MKVFNNIYFVHLLEKGLPIAALAGASPERLPEFTATENSPGTHESPA